MLRKHLSRWDVAERQRIVKMATPSILYMAVYLLWWGILEQIPRRAFTVIHTSLDDMIPFVEFFYPAYLFWFFYVSGTVLYFLFKNQRGDYYRLITFLFTGMTLFLIISTLFPNIHDLRPETFARDNLFTRLIAGLYRIDTPTNLWPSIHVYNAVGVHIAIAKSSLFNENRKVKRASFVACVSIILSTLFIKQHSVFDVVTGLIMAVCFYIVVYSYDFAARVYQRLALVKAE